MNTLDTDVAGLVSKFDRRSLLVLADLREERGLRSDWMRSLARAKPQALAQMNTDLSPARLWERMRRMQYLPYRDATAAEKEVKKNVWMEQLAKYEATLHQGWLTDGTVAVRHPPIERLYSNRYGRPYEVGPYLRTLGRATTADLPSTVVLGRTHDERRGVCWGWDQGDGEAFALCLLGLALRQAPLAEYSRTTYRQAPGALMGVEDGEVVAAMMPMIFNPTKEAA